jgi:hypothetical protein
MNSWRCDGRHPDGFRAEQDMLRAIVSKGPGGANNPNGCKGKPEEEEAEAERAINRDNVMVDSPPVAQKAVQGNSQTYAMNRLRRDRPDLHARVIGGNRDNVMNSSSKQETKRDNVTNCSTLPAPERQGGNSQTYAMNRLRRDRPDLHARGPHLRTPDYAPPLRRSVPDERGHRVS